MYACMRACMYLCACVCLAQGEFLDADEDANDLVLPAPGEPTGEKLLRLVLLLYWQCNQTPNVLY